MHQDTIGADISKDHIDLHRLPGGERLRIPNDRKGFVAILKWIGGLPIDRIVYEPTGAYHKAFERFMIAQGLPIPKSIRALSGVLPKRPAGWPRRIGLMLNCLPAMGCCSIRVFCAKIRMCSMI
jgi:hypothetical protein